jgi:hypothetical protein
MIFAIAEEGGKARSGFVEWAFLFFALNSLFDVTRKMLAFWQATY